jgi:hypothetical protein
MGYAAGALAVFGAIVGLKFRFRVLLPIVVLLFLATLVFALIDDLPIIDILLTIVVAQAILQGGYFGGLVVRSIFRAVVQRKLPLPSERFWSN